MEAKTFDFDFKFISNIKRDDGFEMGHYLHAALTTNIDHLIRDWSLTLDTTGVVKASLMIALFRTDGIPYRREGNIDAAITMTTTVEPSVVVVGSSANIDNIEENFNGNFLKKVIDSIPAAKTWILELGASQQVRSLIPKSIESYFMNKEKIIVVGSALTDTVKMIAKGLPKILQNEETRVKLLTNANEWLVYHTSSSSTADLMFKVKKTLDPIFPNLFSQATKDAIDAAYAQRWNKALADAIPRSAVAVAYIWLKEDNKLRNQWYQGLNAFNDSNPYTGFKIRNIFKKYLDLIAKNHIADIEKLINYQSKTVGLNGF